MRGVRGRTMGAFMVSDGAFAAREIEGGVPPSWVVGVEPELGGAVMLFLTEQSPNAKRTLGVLIVPSAVRTALAARAELPPLRDGLLALHFPALPPSDGPINGRQAA